MPSSRAILRWDHPLLLNALIVFCISILSWFIAAQGHERDPDHNDYLTSKWLVLMRPMVAGFDRPLTFSALSGFPVLNLEAAHANELAHGVDSRVDPTGK